MTVTVVRYTTAPDRADENQGSIERVFAELNAERPDGLRYMSVRLEDGVTFVHVASVETDDGVNPLFSSPVFDEFQREIADRITGGPVAMQGSVVGVYGLPIAVGTADATNAA